MQTCIGVISKEINIESTAAKMERRKEDLKRAALSAEQKLIKFSEYLISKIEKRRDLIKLQINKKLA